MRVEVEVFVEDHSKIAGRFCCVSFNTEKLYWKHRKIFAPLPYMRRYSVLSGFSFSLFVDIHDWIEAKHDCRPFSAAAELPDGKEIYSWLSSA